MEQWSNDMRSSPIAAEVREGPSVRRMLPSRIFIAAIISTHIVCSLLILRLMSSKSSKPEVVEIDGGKFECSARIEKIGCPGTWVDGTCSWKLSKSMDSREESHVQCTSEWKDFPKGLNKLHENGADLLKTLVVLLLAEILMGTSNHWCPRSQDRAPKIVLVARCAWHTCDMVLALAVIIFGAVWTAWVRDVMGATQVPLAAGGRNAFFLGMCLVMVFSVFFNSSVVFLQWQDFTNEMKQLTIVMMGGDGKHASLDTGENTTGAPAVSHQASPDDFARQVVEARKRKIWGTKAKLVEMPVMRRGTTGSSSGVSLEQVLMPHDVESNDVDGNDLEAVPLASQMSSQVESMPSGPMPIACDEIEQLRLQSRRFSHSLSLSTLPKRHI